MTPDQRPATPSPLFSDAQALQRRRRWALLAAAGAAVALGALLGHGLAQSLAGVLPLAWRASSGAWVGAAVAALLVPLSGWAAIRIVAPSSPRRSTLAAVAPLKPVKPQKPVKTPAAQAAIAAAATADAQAPARDALTGAYTQLHFVAAADREWSRIRRHGEDAALLMVDVDHFKRLNDEHGMACGDAMLVEITRLASGTLRPYDLLARFGGGVLVVYLPHTDLLGALDVAERIRERVAGLGLSWEGKRVKATISVGVASIGASHAALDAVIADAGGALREAKAAGRNCVRAAPIPPKRNQAPARSAG
jgi:diguanylate cyclase (GGDEF)-like protein